jgi:hypothetical protein
MPSPVRDIFSVRSLPLPVGVHGDSKQSEDIKKWRSVASQKGIANAWLQTLAVIIQELCEFVNEEFEKGSVQI